MRFIDKHVTEYENIGLRVQPDPERRGARGAVYGWQVVEMVPSEPVVFDAIDRVACSGFCNGVAFARGVEA